MGCCKIWSYHVTQVENLSFLFSKSYFPLNSMKSHQILWLCCIAEGNYKEDNMKSGRICPSPPPPCGAGLSYLILTHVSSCCVVVVGPTIPAYSSTTVSPKKNAGVVIVPQTHRMWMMVNVTIDYNNNKIQGKMFL